MMPDTFSNLIYVIIAVEWEFRSYQSCYDNFLKSPHCNMQKKKTYQRPTKQFETKIQDYVILLTTAEVLELYINIIHLNTCKIFCFFHLGLWLHKELPVNNYVNCSKESVNQSHSFLQKKRKNITQPYYASALLAFHAVIVSKTTRIEEGSGLQVWKVKWFAISFSKLRFSSMHILKMSKSINIWEGAGMWLTQTRVTCILCLQKSKLQHYWIYTQIPQEIGYSVVCKGYCTA